MKNMIVPGLGGENYIPYEKREEKRIYPKDAVKGIKPFEG